MRRNNQVEMTLKGGSLVVVVILLVTACFLILGLTDICKRIVLQQTDLRHFVAQTEKLMAKEKAVIDQRAFEKKQEARKAAEFEDLAQRVQEDSSHLLADTETNDEDSDAGRND